MTPHASIDNYPSFNRLSSFRETFRLTEIRHADAASPAPISGHTR